MKRFLPAILMTTCIASAVLAGCGSPSPYEEGMIRYNGQWITVEEYERIKSGEQSSTTDDVGITTATEPESTSGVIQITAEQLYNEYDANEIAADQKYKGETIQVSGEIEDISKDIVFDEPYITLYAGFLSSVYCYFDKTDESQLAQLSKGQSVTVQGRCTGIGFIDPELRDCVLIR